METKLKRPMSFLLALVVAMVFNFPIGVTSGINGIFNFGMPAKAADITPTQPKNGDGSSGSPYLIGTAAELYWFAAQVNSGKTTINAKLTANITVNTGVLNSDGTLNSSGSFKDWTPIGNESNQYTGTFDGAGYTISGLYFDNTETDYVGLFGYVYEGGSIKNITVDDSYFNGNDKVGGVCGYEAFATLTSCSNKGTVSGASDNAGGTGDNVGGVCGFNQRGKLTSCSNTGTVTGSGNGVGGVCGNNSSYATIENCYNTGAVSGTSNWVGGVCGSNSGAITSCYNTGTVSGKYEVGGVCGSNLGAITSCYYLDGTKSDSYATSKTAAQFGSGEVCYLLSVQTSQQVWGQNLDKEPKDTYPKLSTDTSIKVYKKCSTEGIVYSNSEGTGKHAYNEKGICGCGAYKPAEDSNDDGYYEINNVGNLYWFASYVNGTLPDNETKHPSANAILKENITVNSGVLNAKGALNTSGSFTDWTPIGSETNPYEGTFDGDGHTISGLYFNNTSTDNVGLFSYVYKGSIKNINIADSYFYGKNEVGGVCGFNQGGTLTSCSNTGAVSGKLEDVGGVCGYNSSGSITNCSNTGAVKGGSYGVGGVCGSSSGTITSCYNTGTVTSNTFTHVAGVCGYSGGSITYCYYDSTVYKDGKAVGNMANTENVTGKVTKAFESGEVCYLLNGSKSTGDIAWGQLLSGDENADKFPVHLTTSNSETHTVYGGYTKCDENEPMQYANTTIGTAERPAHTTSEGFKCSVCNTALVDITGFNTNYVTLTEDWTQSVYEVNGTTAVAEPTDITVKGGSNIITVYFNIDGKANLVKSYTLTVTDESGAEVKTVTSQFQTIFANIGMAQLVHTLSDGTYNVSITLNAANDEKITETAKVTVPTSAE